MLKTKISKNRLITLLKSLIMAYVVTVVLLLLLAFLLLKLELNEKMVSVGIALIYIISCFAGGFLAGKKIKEKKFLWGLAVGAGYFLLLLGISTIMEPGAMASASYIVSAAALCAGGGTLGGMIS
ncbi:MAG: TIGR04086 family membrane protein [Ruminococcus sp.]|jgi:putative membrane protein (TIGR04086 family)